MAVVIRFNTIVVRKAAVDARFPGGLAAYRALHLPDGAAWYHEDRHLIAHGAMGAFHDVEERLLAMGLASREGAGTDDCCAAGQADGVDPACGWLRSAVVGGLPVCWLAAEPPGHVVDVKGRRVVRRACATACAGCGRALDLAAAAMAVDAREWRDGPLAFVDPDAQGAGSGWVAVCGACGAATAVAGRA